MLERIIMKKMNIIVVFDKELKNTLMCKRVKEPYMGMYNLVGGKILQELDEKYLGCNLTGLDISSDMIAVAQTRNFTGRNNITFVTADFMKYDFKEYYDIVIFKYVLHHMNNPIEALKKVKSILADSGKILFSVPGNAYLSEIF